MYLYIHSVLNHTQQHLMQNSVNTLHQNTISLCFVNNLNATHKTLVKKTKVDWQAVVTVLIVEEGAELIDIQRSKSNDSSKLNVAVSTSS